MRKDCSKSINKGSFTISPITVEACDWTLDDVVRFCTPVSGFSIMGIDPMFNLGAFDVTVTTYRQLLLTAQQNAVKHPVCIGPLFVHVKDFSAYHFFASSLVGRQPALKCKKQHWVGCASYNSNKCIGRLPTLSFLAHHHKGKDRIACGLQ